MRHFVNIWTSALCFIWHTKLKYKLESQDSQLSKFVTDSLSFKRVISLLFESGFDQKHLYLSYIMVKNQYRRTLVYLLPPALGYGLGGRKLMD